MADLVNIAARLATLEGMLRPVLTDGYVLTADSTNQHGAEWLPASGMPDGVYMDEYGNIVFGADNIAAFPTDRAGELSDCYIGYGTIFIPPPVGYEIHGLVLLGNADDDHSGAYMFDGSLLTAGEIRALWIDNAVCQPKGDTTITNWRCHPMSYLNTETDGVSVIHDGELLTPVDGLSGSGTIDLTHFGTGTVDVSGVIDHVARSDSGAGHWTISGRYGVATDGTRTFAGLRVKNAGAESAKDLTVIGYGSVDINRLKTPLTIKNHAGPSVTVDSNGAGSNNLTTVDGLHGFGSVDLVDLDASCHLLWSQIDGAFTVNGDDGLVDVSGLYLAYGGFTTLIPSGASGISLVATEVRSGAQLNGTGDGALIGYTTIESGFTLDLEGNSQVVACRLANGGSIATAGYDMNNVEVSAPGAVTLTGDNTSTYKGYGVDTLV